MRAPNCAPESRAPQIALKHIVGTWSEYESTQHFDVITAIEQDRHEVEVAELAVEHRRDRLQRALWHRLAASARKPECDAFSRIETQNGSVPSCWSTPPPWSERRPHLRIARRMNGRSSDSR